MNHSHVEIPPLREIGTDLLWISRGQRFLTLSWPFFWCGVYWVFAGLGWWPLAVFALVALSFMTYGSTSHDLVHRNLGLPNKVNDILLCMIELLALRSGHAYQAVHLHHHARYPHLDDIEAAAARRGFLGALREGVSFQFRIWVWAIRNAREVRRWIIGEGLACLVLGCLALGTVFWSPAPIVYAVLMVMGSWVIPLATAYLTHDPNGNNELFQTRLFRGTGASLISLEHLYHLEHHLYPSVPHRNWLKLAKRLDPFLEAAGVRPVIFWK